MASTYKYSKYNYWFHRIPNEALLRKQLLIPLFEKMGCDDVRDNHGIFELGKDIVGKHDDSYFAIVAKKGDINASDTDTIIRQMNQCFGITYSSKQDGESVEIKKVYIITDGSYLGSTHDTLVGMKNLYKKLGLELVIWDGKDLLNECDKYLNTAGIVGDSNVIYARYVESNVTRLIIDPKEDGEYHGQVIQMDDKFVISIIWNEETRETVKEIEIIDWRNEFGGDNNENHLEVLKQLLANEENNDELE
jgi:hypothetical protein